MKKAELFRRYLTLCLGLFFTALGVSFAKHAGLGVSPIASMSNVLSCKFTSLSLGSWMIIWNCAMILGQILILRRNFQLIQLLQVPLSFVFGWFGDLGLWLVSPIPLSGYLSCLAMTLVGILCTALGVNLAVVANVILNSGEGLVKAIADTTGKPFGNMKVAWDISCITMAVILSLIFFDMKIVGVREGTILAGVFVGLIVKRLDRFVRPPVLRFILCKEYSK